MQGSERVFITEINVDYCTSTSCCIADNLAVFDYANLARCELQTYTLRERERAYQKKKKSLAIYRCHSSTCIPSAGPAVHICVIQSTIWASSSVRGGREGWVAWGAMTCLSDDTAKGVKIS